MDNINKDFENFYRATAHQVQQQQQQQQQLQQLQNQQQHQQQQHQNHHQQQQHQNQQHQHQQHQHQQHQHQQHQNQQLSQQQIQNHHLLLQREQQQNFQLNQQQQQQHLLQNGQIPQHQFLNANFDEQTVLNLVSNDYYPTNQFNHAPGLNTSSSQILLDSIYKYNSDNQSLFMDQIKEENLQRRRNSDILFNNNDTSGNNNYIYTRPPQQLQQQQEHAQQQNALVSDANTIMSSFDPSITPLVSGITHSNFKQTPRKEQDVFCELISLATKNNTIRHDIGSWQSHVNTSTAHYVPSYFTNNLCETSSSAQTQQTQETQQTQKQQQISQSDGLKYYTTSSLAFAKIAKAAAIKALAGPSNTTKEKSITTNTELDHTPNSNERIYQLLIAQQPSRARMCGFGDKDRRPITPPPIIQLIVTTKSGEVVNPETFDISFLVVMCDSWQQSELEDEDESSYNHAHHTSQVISFPATKMDEEGVETDSAIKMRSLVGSSVSSATKLYDLNGNLGIYFVFQDVSLRTEGRFRLKFSLLDVGSPYSHSVNTTTNSRVLKTICSEPFTVYTAKKFPGVVQSTPLSKCFARQGIKIPIRKEKLNSTKNKKKLANRDLETKLSDEDDCDDE